MASNPDTFKYMSTLEIAATLVIDEANERRRKASLAGARCESCLDAGMTGRGLFCECSQGRRLAQQGNRA
jgi:hypothetical protein